jgi:hypothetical protein
MRSVVCGKVSYILAGTGFIPQRNSVVFLEAQKVFSFIFKLKEIL